MDADFECVGQTKLTHRIGQHGQIGIELTLEGRDVADIVHALVEASGELRRDGLGGNPLVGNHSQNDQQLARSLRRVGFIHRDLDSKSVRRFRSCDMTVDPSRLLHGPEKFARRALKIGAGDFQRRVEQGKTMRTNQPGALFKKRLHALRACGFAGIIRHIEREEITRRNEAIHRVQVDVIGIHKVRRGPVQCLHGGIRFGTEIGGFRSNEGVLTVRFVPNRVKRHTAFCSGLDCGKLGLALLGKTIAHADGESWEFFHSGWIFGGRFLKRVSRRTHEFSPALQRQGTLKR